MLEQSIMRIVNLFQQNGKKMKSKVVLLSTFQVKMWRDFEIGKVKDKYTSEEKIIKEEMQGQWPK